MATRNVYYLDQQNRWHTARQNFWWPKMTKGTWADSKRNAAPHLMKSFLANHPGHKFLEVSSASQNPLGKNLSAFRLSGNPGAKNPIKLETIYQASKEFGSHGNLNRLFTQHLAKNKSNNQFYWAKGTANPREAKFAANLYQRRYKLTGFRLGGKQYGLNPKGAFYNYIYTIALARHPKLYNQVAQYNAFSDIQARPGKTFNTQAQACTVFNSLLKSGRFNAAMKSYPDFVKNSEMIHGRDINPDIQRKAAAQRHMHPSNHIPSMNQPSKPSVNHTKTVQQPKFNPSAGISLEGAKPKAKPAAKSKGKKKFVKRGLKWSAKGKPSILDTKASAILAPVNTFGTMKTGIDSQLKKRHYEMFRDYRYLCYEKHDTNPKTGRPYSSAATKVGSTWHQHYHHQGQGMLQPGLVLYYKIPKKQQNIVMIPVKTDWRMNRHFKKTNKKNIIIHNQIQNRKDRKQMMSNLKKGLEGFKRTYKKHHITSLAVPEFDSKTGGLNWPKQAKPIIENELKGTGIKLMYYNPYATPKDEKQAELGKKPSVTALDLNKHDPFAKKPQSSSAPVQHSASQAPQSTSASASSSSKNKSDEIKTPKMPDMPIDDTNEVNALKKRLGKNYPPFIQAIGDEDALFKNKHHLTVYGPHKIDKKSAYNIAKTTHQLDQTGIVPVTGLNTGSDTIMAKQAVKDNAPQVNVLASNFQYIAPQSNTNLVADATQHKNYIISPHRNSDFVNFKKADTYQSRDHMLNDLGNNVLLTQVQSKDGQLVGNGIYNAKYAHDHQRKHIYTIPANNSEETNDLLKTELGAQPIDNLIKQTQKENDKSKSESAANEFGSQFANDPDIPVRKGPSKEEKEEQEAMIESSFQEASENTSSSSKQSQQNNAMTFDDGEPIPSDDEIPVFHDQSNEPDPRTPDNGGKDDDGPDL